MQQLKDWSPTSFDVKGLGPENRQDWLVAPAEWLKRLGGLSEDVEWHTFSHWAMGKLQVLFVRLGSKAAEKARKLEVQYGKD